jgi:DNA gyrase/topoisomerase IV subunit B
VTELLRAALDGFTREREDSDHSETSLDELPVSHDVVPERQWVSDRVRQPRERTRIVANIREHPAASVGDLTRPAALGTLLEGAMAFALDDAVDGNCEWIDVRLLRDGSAMVTYGGPGFPPDRASRGLQRWPWVRRSPEGEVVLTQSLAAPVVTCALSHWCRLEIRRADGTWRQAFYRGEQECPLRREPPDRLQATQTRLHFRPDARVFGDLGFSVDDLYMRGLGFSVELCGIELRIHDERTVAPALVMVGMG